MYQLDDSRTRIINSVLFTLLGALLFIPFLDMSGPAVVLGDTWDYFTLVACMIILIALVFIIHKIRMTFFVIGIFYIIILISTKLNNRDIFPALYYSAKNIAFIALIEYCARKRKLLKLISLMKRTMGIIILITLYFQIINPGFWGYTISHKCQNFLASDNFLGYYYIPFIVIVYLDSRNKGKRIQHYNLLFWVLICLISLVKAWGVTCLMIFIVFAVTLVLDKNHFFSMITPLRSFIINAGISWLVIIFRIQNLFEWLIVGILHKSMSLSNRTYVWRAAIANFLQKPILGYGTAKGGRLSINYAVEVNRTYFSHNMFLEVLIQGGIIALVSLIFVYAYANWRMKKCNEKEIRAIIFLAIFSLLLMQFSEFALYIPFANLPLILCFFNNELQCELSKEKI